MRDKVFISHRSVDKDVADMLLDFFTATGIPQDVVFCSSLPGNDVKCKISEEIKQAILSSAVNIVILSNEYYNSVYCLNEAGVVWFIDTPAIVIAMPEITPNNMHGFLNDEYKLRYLDNDNDISAIYDQIADSFSVVAPTATKLTYAISKLKTRYDNFLKTRNNTKMGANVQEKIKYDEITTDDERVVLYYLLSNNVRKVSDKDVEKWLLENEIYNINIANAFDLLSAVGWGIITAEENALIFEIEISHFRSLSKTSTEITNLLQEAMIRHCRLSKDWFIAMWDTSQFDESDMLFISYTRDENVFSYGSRWKAELEVESIKNWQAKNSIESPLPNDYEKCLNKFIENSFVYASSWTSHGNPREYALHKSIKEFFFSSDFPYANELETVKVRYYFELPF